MDNQALVVGIGTLLGAAVYAYVGWRLAKRPTSPETRVPALQFALFWVGLAASTLLGSIESLIAAFQPVPFGIAISFLYYNATILVAALWGLVSYLYFLYTGRDGSIPLGALYGLLFALVVYYFSAGMPNGVSVTHGTVSSTFAAPVTGPVEILAVLILLVPEFVAVFAYLRLFFRTRDATVRYRIAMVSGGLLGWFFLDFLNVGNLSNGNLFWLFTGQVFLIIAALVVLMAYYPPQFVRQRFQVVGISDAQKG